MLLPKFRHFEGQNFKNRMSISKTLSINNGKNLYLRKVSKINRNWKIEKVRNRNMAATLVLKVESEGVFESDLRSV